MKYSVKLNGKQYEVEVEKIESDFRALTKAEVSGEQVTAVQSQTRQEPAAVPAAPAVATAPAAPAAPVQTPTASAGECQILSPMPGKVLDVKASVGQSVRAGDVIVVIEAMKMENEIVAPQDGVVDSIPVKSGDTLEADAVLAVLK